MQGKDKNIYAEVKEHFRIFYKDIFPENKGQFERHFDDNIKLEASEKLFETVKISADINRDSKILDIGCGFGSFVLFCRKKGFAAYGIDSSDYEINFAKRRFFRETSVSLGGIYQRASAEALPFKKDSFDVVTLWNLLEHVPDYKKVLDEADRVLKKGGTLFLVAPNYLTIREEAHYHIMWFSVIPRRLAISYLKMRGKDPKFFLNNIFYVTGPGVSGYLKGKGYVLGVDNILKLDNSALCHSKWKAKLINLIEKMYLKPFLKKLIMLNYFNPFKSVINICSKKR
ncbi:MAG: class I SAM-dependent methyltransferase [Candidatus Aureabacteria bacterium]|nr:class I SAM-dependent methyltransferase [Candidatus Auribacterota bacterium]